MDTTITLTVNGRTHSITTESERPLLDVLREDLQLTGTKYGCGEGQCRACTVLLNGKAVAACVTPAGKADKQEVLTVEGLAQGEQLHPVQQAFLTEGASQCGYCTPGMIMEVVGVLKEKPRASAEDLRSGLQRHICRCCNYPKLTKALERTATQEGR